MNPMLEYFANRGLHTNPQPDDVRFHPNLYNFTSNKRHPAMVAAIRNEAGNIIAVHQTFLTPAGLKISGEGVKDKLVTGAYSGGAIRLASATDKLALTEGIEDALTIIQTTGWPCWATVSASNIPDLPPEIHEMLLCPDADKAGRAWAEKAGARYASQGRTVKVAYPPASYKDFNAALMAEKQKAAPVEAV